MAKVVYETQESTAIIPMSYRQLGRIAGIGLAVGLIAWILGHLLDAYVFKMILCAGDTPSMKCSTSYQYANAGAMILAAGAGLFALVKLQLYRPLMIGVLATLALWGVLDKVWSLPWHMSLLYAAIIFAAAYALFAWTARIRPFIIALGISIILLVIVRLAFTA
jgi:hypothetical protein